MTGPALEHLRSGSALPPVTLNATDGRSVCLGALSGRSVVAIYPWTGRPGYPNPPNWDDIPGALGSTPELEGFRDHYPDFENHGTRVFGLSGQATDYQQEVVSRLALPFPLLSDAEGVFAKALHLPRFATGGETYLRRLTVVVRDGHVEHVFYPVFDLAAHAGEMLKLLDLESG